VLAWWSFFLWPSCSFFYQECNNPPSNLSKKTSFFQNFKKNKKNQFFFSLGVRKSIFFCQLYIEGIEMKKK